MQKFFQGGPPGANLRKGQKRGGEAYVRCYTLHLLGGDENDTWGGNAPPRSPLNTALDIRSVFP